MYRTIKELLTYCECIEQCPLKEEQICYANYNKRSYTVKLTGRLLQLFTMNIPKIMFVFNKGKGLTTTAYNKIVLTL